MGWSVRMPLMACFTQNSGFRGGRKGSISFLNGKKTFIFIDSKVREIKIEKTDKILHLLGKPIIFD